MRPKKIHFMGIGGSGMSAVAQIAHSQGYSITGCDLTLDTPYINKVVKLGIPVAAGHDPRHLAAIDLLTVTPAVFYISDNHPETSQAKARGILMKWQDFMGTYLHQNKFLICIAGTHGKSTTTSLAGLLLEAAGLDPTVEVGATVKAWHNNVRLGNSKYFISEADEFHDNFATYKSDIILLTLVEYDHPEYFGSIDSMLACYQRFIDRLKPGGTVIYNADSPLAHKLRYPQTSLPYRLSDFPPNLVLSQPGNHSKLNALAILNLAQVLAIPLTTAESVLRSYSGLERRLDFIGEKKSIKVYDDYANHPSSYSATLSAIKQLHPQSRIWAIIEPHTFSRLRVMLAELPDSIKLADLVIVSRIFASREKDPGDFTGQDIAQAMRHPNCRYIPEFSNICSLLSSEAKSGDVIIVMGSGNSHKLAREILTLLPA